MYCEKCRMITEGARCPECGADTREPRPGDACLAGRFAGVFPEMYADLLRQTGIPFLSEGELGAGIASIVGTRTEVTAFYVPYERLEEAEAIARGFFGGEGEEAPEA